MRLTKDQRYYILLIARKHYGEHVKVKLFGSRIDDQRKGGDIDLLILSSEEKMNLKTKVLFLVDLKKYLGNQKIDVVYDKTQNRKGIFIQSIRENSISL